MKNFLQTLLRRGGRRLALLAGGLAFAASAQAGPFVLIDATTDGLPPDPGFANVAFSLTYEDVDLDGLFSLGELLAFTGFTDAMGSFFGLLEAVPSVPGIITGSGAGDVWTFGDGVASVSFGAARFTPFVQSAGVIAAPGSAALLAAALLALTTLRRQPAGRRR